MADEYLNDKSDGLVTWILNFPKNNHPEMSVEFILAGGAVVRSLRLDDQRPKSTFDFDFFIVGEVSEATAILQHIYHDLRHHRNFFSADLKPKTLDIKMTKHDGHFVYISFILKSFWSRSKN